MRPRGNPLDCLQRCLCPLATKRPTSKAFFSSSASRCETSLQEQQEDVVLLTRRVPTERKSPIRRIATGNVLDPPLPVKPYHSDRLLFPTTVRFKPSAPLEGLDLLADLAKRWKFPDVLEHAVDMVKDGHKPSLEMYSCLIEACANFQGCLLQDLAFNLFDEMKSLTISPDARIYHNLLRLLSNSPDYIKRAEIIEEMKIRWYKLSDDSWQWIILGYLKDGHLEMALEIIDERPEVIALSTYEETIKALCKLGEADEAYKLTCKAIGTQFENRELSAALYYELLVASAKELHLEATKFAWKKVIETERFTPDDGLCLLVLHTAARNGDPMLATDVFRILAQRATRLEEHHYAALIETYTVTGDISSALSVLSLMVDAGVLPSRNTARSISLKLAESAEAVDGAFTILQEMKENGKEVEISMFNAVVAAAVQRNDLMGAFKLYSRISELDLQPVLDTFNILLKGAALEGRKDVALFVIGEMRERAIVPTVRTYEHLIKMSLNQADYDDAFGYLEEMKNIGFWVRGTVYRWILEKCLENEDPRAAIVVREMRDKGIDTSFIKKNKREGANKY
ncbi:hypothetical protein RUND412_003629 [Rhizina undulata]